MTKDIILQIKGLQYENSPDDQVEVINVGEYYFKNEKHYILYDEVSEEYNGITKNTIKIQDHAVEVIKKGAVNVHMIFEEKRKNMTYYDLGSSSMLVGLSANNIDVKKKEDNLSVKIDYSLEINNAHISDCSIFMEIKSKDSAVIELQ